MNHHQIHTGSRRPISKVEERALLNSVDSYLHPDSPSDSTDEVSWESIGALT